MGYEIRLHVSLQAPQGCGNPFIGKEIASGKALAMTMTENCNFIIPSVLFFDLPKYFSVLFTFNHSLAVFFRREE